MLDYFTVRLRESRKRLVASEAATAVISPDHPMARSSDDPIL
jgi:hypothetical protein